MLTQTTIYKLDQGSFIKYTQKMFCKSNISYALIGTHPCVY